MSPIIYLIIVLALGFDFLNGIHDSSNIVATMISSRALSPRMALSMTAVAEFSGPLIFGVAVANTIGHEIVLPETINEFVLLAALNKRNFLEFINLVSRFSKQFFTCPDWRVYGGCGYWCRMESNNCFRA